MLDGVVDGDVGVDAVEVDCWFVLLVVVLSEECDGGDVDDDDWLAVLLAAILADIRGGVGDGDGGVDADGVDCWLVLLVVVVGGFCDGGDAEDDDD